MLEEKEFTSSQSNARHQYEIQKGRAGRKTSRDKKMYGPPQDESWIWLTTELLSSDAWRSMSINCMKRITPPYDTIRIISYFICYFFRIFTDVHMNV